MQYVKSNENAKVVMREKEEGWIKPIKCAPIVHFARIAMKKIRMSIGTIG